MGTIIMNMCGDQTSQDALAAAEYGDEVLSAGWNPVVSLEHLVTEKQVLMPAELADVNVEKFLQKMYGCLS